MQQRLGYYSGSTSMVFHNQKFLSPVLSKPPLIRWIIFCGSVNNLSHFLSRVVPAPVGPGLAGFPVPTGLEDYGGQAWNSELPSCGEAPRRGKSRMGGRKCLSPARRAPLKEQGPQGGPTANRDPKGVQRRTWRNRKTESRIGFPRIHLLSQAN